MLNHNHNQIPFAREYKHLRQILIEIAALVVVMLGWELFVRWNPNSLVPSPTMSLIAIYQMVREGTLIIDCLTSLQRVLVGFSVASCVGIILGLVFGLVPAINRAFSLSIELLRPIPPIAWIPLSLVLFGLGDPSAYFVIFVGAFFPVFTNTLLGVKEVPKLYFEVAQTIGVSPFRTFRHLVWPAALPSLFAGLRVGLGFAWMCVVAAEMIAARSGLGYAIQFNRQLLLLDRVVGDMLVIGFMGFLMARIMLLIERFVLPWRYARVNHLQGRRQAARIAEALRSTDTMTNANTHIPSILADCDRIDPEQDKVRGSQVEVSDLHFTYPNGYDVINDLTLCADPGETLCLLGASGCGKTTLLRLIAGLEKVKQGRISIDGEAVEDRQDDIAMLFQGASLFPWRTAAENVMFALHRHIPDRKERFRVAVNLLKMTGLEQKAFAYPHQLSGGEQQRVAIARALAQSPRVLLLDEPFSALDSQTRESLQLQVSRLVWENGITVIMVTHDIAEALFMGNRVIVMAKNGGKLIDQLDVDIPIPRDPKFRHLAEVNEMNARLWKALHDMQCVPQAELIDV